ncbi:Predicted N-acetyltransferase YhbS [Sphingomonas gellani]|uniref:Predicted N-acetyltransferase YhbS n=1 Tax=Sphingomonas gellani TaxID=1166340 RepID=A0A1H8G3Q2_9SPHN|nr:GNAT family N-acetyltransferase [Sphingomonas gellani]SEN38127.1 Predicted N-acetyltransferase YhbS [Sphingomonas gellani]
MTTALSWRLAEPADVPGINALTARSIRALHADSYDPAVIDEAVSHAYGVDWQLVRDGTYFVAEIDGAVVGAGGWSYRQTIAGAHGPDDPPGDRLDPAMDAARVRAFYVDPAYVRRGVGAVLLRLSEDGARAAGFARAELTSTIPAVPFYASFGYAPVRPFDLRLPSGSTLRLELMDKPLIPRSDPDR